MAASSETDPRVERSQAAVLAAAADLLLECGVGGFTVEAIVERSGVARSTIYRHWDTRRELLLATLDRLLPAPRDPDVEGALRERLVALGEAHVRRLRNAPWAAALPMLLDAASRDPELAGVRERLVEENTGPTRRTLQLAIDRGELPTDTDVDEAIGQLAGPTVFRHLITGQGTGPDYVRRNVELFLASRGAR